MGSSSSKPENKEIKNTMNKSDNNEINNDLIKHLGSKILDNHLKNNVIHIKNRFFDKNAQPPKRLLNIIAKAQLTKESIDNKQFKSHLRRTIRLDCLKNMSINENSRKALTKISLDIRKQNILKTKISK